MPKHSSALDLPFKRDEIADDLYNRFGAEDARRREAINASLGSQDLLQTLSQLLNLKAGQTVFDVGCGSGKHLKHFSEIVGATGIAIGSDFSLAATNNTKNLGLDCVVADGSILPFQSQSADAINCAYAIYYFSRIKSAIQEFFRVLKPSGNLVICGPGSDTNKELYAFHRNLTGKQPSDADLMAMGYVENKVKPIALEIFGSIEEHTFNNQINFPSYEDFIRYWQSTSLVRRTLSDSERVNFAKEAKEVLSKMEQPIFITKTTCILQGVKPI